MRQKSINLNELTLISMTYGYEITGDLSATHLTLNESDVP